MHCMSPTVCPGGARAPPGPYDHDGTAAMYDRVISPAIERDLTVNNGVEFCCGRVLLSEPDRELAVLTIVE